jgi:serine/threonine protein kinase
LDFGIAKLLNPEFMQAPLVTQTDWRPMTPDYASPEQVRGETVTNATDIYSLGVVLYQLLSGHRPYRVRQHSFSEFERLVCEVEPELPSSMGRKELRRHLLGDLDAIVMKALRKEPQQRYPSVQELADDIDRHLKETPAG